MTEKPFKKIEFEVQVPRGVVTGNPRWVSINDKYTDDFHSGLEYLKKRGYKRHPSPREIFSLLMEEEDISREYAVVKRDIYMPIKLVRARNIQGTFDYDSETPETHNARLEWLNLIVHRRGDLITFAEPCVIGENGELQEKFFPYELDISESDKTKEIEYCPFVFHRGEPPPKGTFIPIDGIQELNSDIVPFLWSRKFSDIPEDIRRNCGLVVPPDPYGHYAAFGWSEFIEKYTEDSTFVINAYNVGNAASRGVKENDQYKDLEI